jgi:hypothetical protein
MTSQHLLSRLDAAEARLALTSAATCGHGVAVLWLDEARRSDPSAVPDAFYVNRGDPYTETLLYDVRRNRYLTIGWGDWLEAQEAGR